MPLPTQSFSQLVNNQAAAIKSSSTQLTDFSPGSILRALVESNAGNSLWIQGLISSLLAIARLQTSTGNDVDTFINAFGYYRSPAVAASGNVTFTRTITTNTSYIPASTTVIQESLNNISFTTYINKDNANYDPTTNSYVMLPGTSSITVPVQCNTAGGIGNVEAGAIDTISSTLVNVNEVTNGSAFTNGADIATDAQAIAGFPIYLAGLSAGTLAAITSAVVSVPGVTRYSIVENQNESGSTQLGYFYVVIDNGAGNISDTIKNQVSAAVNAIRGLSIQYNIDKATANEIPANPPVSATIHVPIGTTPDQKSAITATIQTNIVSFLASLPIGGTFFYTRLIQILYDASPLITDVESVTLNGGTSSFTSGALEVPTVNASNISITYSSP